MCHEAKRGLYTFGPSESECIKFGNRQPRSIMLSAIAVRKARLGLGDSQEGPRNVVKEATKSSSPSVFEERITASGKRKHVVPPSPPKKPSKRNKTKTTPPSDTPRQRYFEENASVGHHPKDDVIAVEDDRVNSDEGLVSRDEEDLGLGEISPIPTVMASTTAQYHATRRWSPSVPMRDSSDEGSEGEPSPDIDTRAALPPPRPPPQASAHQPSGSSLSTFQPIFGRNTFRLSDDDVSDLRLCPQSSDDAVTMVVLGCEDVLALLGTYALVVVHGSVSISGVTVRASRDAHRVFAPRSSPVPVIRCVDAEPSCSLLPSRFESLEGHCGAVVVLQSLRTGIEGLGLICRIFERFFEPPHPRTSRDDEVELLPSVHLVRWVHYSGIYYPHTDGRSENNLRTFNLSYSRSHGKMRYPPYPAPTVTSR